MFNKTGDYSMDKVHEVRKLEYITNKLSTDTPLASVAAGIQTQQTDSEVP